MVHSRYIRIKGKKFGPYYYETYRDGGKIKNRYLGKPKIADKIFSLKAIFLLAASLLFLAAVVFLIRNNNLANYAIYGAQNDNNNSAQQEPQVVFDNLSNPAPSEENQTADSNISQENLSQPQPSNEYREPQIINPPVEIITNSSINNSGMNETSQIVSNETNFTTTILPVSNFSNNSDLNSFNSDIGIQTSAANIPKTLNIQGKITNSSAGKIVSDGIYDFIFKIYDSETGGSAVWIEEQNLTTRKGVYSAILGAANPINFTFDKQFYLETTINSEILSPRLKMTNMPYSFASINASESSFNSSVEVYASQVKKTTGTTYLGQMLDSIIDSLRLLIDNLETNKLNVTDQRYNDTSYVNTKAAPGNCMAGFAVQNTTTSGVQCINITQNALTETDPIFAAENSTLWTAINGKLAETDQRYNDTLLIISVNTTSNIMSLGFYNKSEVDSLVVGMNNSWNQSLADMLYAGIQWNYNQTYTGGTYNSTYNIYAYNQTTAAINDINSRFWNRTQSYNKTEIDALNASWSSTYNSTYAGFAYNQTAPAINYADNINTTLSNRIDNLPAGGNSSFNQSLTDTLYAAIKWGYNMTAPFTNWLSTFVYSYNQTIPANAYTDSIVSANNASWTSTYNSTYAGYSFGAINDTLAAYNLWNSVWLSTYNATYDKWAYNQTYSGSTYNATYAGYSFGAVNDTLATYNLWNTVWLSTYNATYNKWAYNQTYSGSTYNATYDAKNTSQWIRSGGNIYYQNLTGKVGIGTASPRYGLDILGNVRIITASDTSLFVSQIGTGKLAEFRTHLPGASNLMIESSLNELSTILVPKSSLEFRLKASVVWTAKSAWNIPSVGEFICVGFADLDNDGDYDLIIGERYGYTFAYENTGSATSPVWTYKPAWNTPDIGWRAAPTFADLDDDGDYDLMIGEDSGTSFAYENTGSATSPVWTAKSAWNAPNIVTNDASPAFADLDNDGDYDLMIGGGTKGYGYENTGNRTSPAWTAKSAWDTPATGNLVVPAFADLDKDGDYDLIIGDYYGGSYGYENTGNRTSPAWTAKSAWNAPNIGNHASPALADLDNDGDYDLLIAAGDGASYGYENTGLDSFVTFGQTGNVGIGTSSPATKLHVNGTITTNMTGTGNDYVCVNSAGVLFRSDAAC
jgi:hypothetical protein